MAYIEDENLTIKESLDERIRSLFSYLKEIQLPTETLTNPITPNPEFKNTIVEMAENSGDRPSDLKETSRMLEEKDEPETDNTLSEE